MPRKFNSEVVKSAQQVVGRVSTPDFGPMDDSNLDAVIQSMSPEDRQLVAGFIDCGSYLQQSTESAGGGLLGTSEGRVVNGLGYALSLVTTQNSTNSKNRVRSQFNQPVSQEKLKEQALGEFFKLAQTDLEKMKEIAGQPGGGEAWVAGRMKELEGEHESRRKEMIAQAAQQNSQADANDAADTSDQQGGIAGQ